MVRQGNSIGYFRKREHGYARDALIALAGTLGHRLFQDLRLLLSGSARRTQQYNCQQGNKQK